jgi:hypothetical protein
MAGIAFVVLSPGADPDEHQVVLSTPAFDLTVVAVPDYTAAIQAAKRLLQSGIETIELCGGFGHGGVAQVCQAVPEAHVGVVRFDGHPGLKGKSGDAFFAG